MSVEVSLDLECGACGHRLIGTGGSGGISVDPCDHCLDDAHNAGYDEGRDSVEDEAE